MNAESITVSPEPGTAVMGDVGSRLIDPGISEPVLVNAKVEPAVIGAGALNVMVLAGPLAAEATEPAVSLAAGLPTPVSGGASTSRGAGVERAPALAATPAESSADGAGLPIESSCTRLPVASESARPELRVSRSRVSSVTASFGAAAERVTSGLSPESAAEPIETFS
jgi:hypothetical protein